MNGRTLSDAQLARLTLAELNSGLSCYREDLRYSRADALRAAELWNASKAATCATVATVDGLPVVVVAEAPPACENAADGGCERLFDCCNCGGHDCGCRYCFPCNACPVCTGADGDA